jgi:hypothetical protein
MDANILRRCIAQLAVPIRLRYRTNDMRRHECSARRARDATPFVGNISVAKESA